MQNSFAKRSFKSFALLTVAVLFAFSACKESENLVSPGEDFRPNFVPPAGYNVDCLPIVWNGGEIQSQGNKKKVGNLTFEHSANGEFLIVTLETTDNKKLNNAGVVWRQNLSDYHTDGFLTGGGNSKNYNTLEDWYNAMNLNNGLVQDQNQQYRVYSNGDKKAVFTIPMSVVGNWGVGELIFAVYCSQGWGVGNAHGPSGHNGWNGHFIRVTFNDCSYVCDCCGITVSPFTPDNGNCSAGCGNTQECNNCCVCRDCTCEGYCPNTEVCGIPLTASNLLHECGNKCDACPPMSNNFPGFYFPQTADLTALNPSGSTNGITNGFIDFSTKNGQEVGISHFYFAGKKFQTAGNGNNNAYRNGAAYDAFIAQDPGSGRKFIFTVEEYQETGAKSSNNLVRTWKMKIALFCDIVADGWVEYAGTVVCVENDKSNRSASFEKTRQPQQ